MVKPILLIVRRKTKVPTKNNVRFDFRYDWKTALRIEYKDGQYLFTKINNDANISNTAQFAKFLYDRLGVGTYHINGWQKGRRGIINFLYLQLFPDGFQIIKRKPSVEENSVKDRLTEIKSLKNQLKNTNIEHEREGIIMELDDLQGDMDISLDKEIIALDKKIKRFGALNYLTFLKPTFRFHQYQPYNRRAKSVKSNNFTNSSVNIYNNVSYASENNEIEVNQDKISLF